MGENPYLARQRRHAIGKAGRMAEDRFAKKLKGRSRPASGAMLGAKGDIEVGKVLMEVKSTTNDSLGIRLEYLAKISHEARHEGKMPALAILFTRGDGTPHPQGDWVMIPRRVWEENVRDD